MKVWDSQGRLKIAFDPALVTFSFVADDRYIRRDASTIVNAGIEITFSDAGSNIKIKNGRLCIKDDTDGLWYPIGRNTTLYPGDTPI